MITLPGGQRVACGCADLQTAGAVRRKYIGVLRDVDKRGLPALIAFPRS